MNRQRTYKFVLALLLMLVFAGIHSARQVTAQVNAWEASYFDNAQLEGRPVVSVFESAIRHDWGDGAPTASSALPADFFSVRWIGQITTEANAQYRFYASADDSIRVYVNADLVINNWETPAATEGTAVVDLGRGTHTIRVEYRDFENNAFAHFGMEFLGGTPPVASGGGSGDCVIPESGPWPPCATGGGSGGGSTAAAGGDGCVIPDSGPWPPCATEPAPAEPAPAPPSPGEAQPIVVPNGLLAYYAFDENTNFVVDSANGVNGTISNNVNRVAGPRNGALRIDSGGSVYIPNAATNSITTGDFSMGMWVRSVQQVGVQRLLDKRATSPSLIGYHMFVWDGKVGMQLADGNGDVNRCKFDAGQPRCTNYQSNASIADGNWHFVMITVDRNLSSGMRFYVDGTLVETLDPTGRQGSLSSGQNIPLVFDSNGAPLEIDEFYLYDRVLGAGEVSTLYNNR